MRSIPVGLRRQVVFRAGGRCEYCGLAQEGQEATLRKEARRSGQDPQTGRTVALFNPRRQLWANHFHWDGFAVVGLTPTGRTTIAALKLNRPSILAIRAEESARGRHPLRH
jgi:hypothetical protein